MAAIPKDKLEALEAKHRLTAGNLTYQQRCSRIAKYEKGESWEGPKNPSPRRGTIDSRSPIEKMTQDLKLHPLYGKKILITPMMVPDKNRAIYFEEPVGHDIQVEEISAGAALFGAPDDVDRLVGDYKIIRENPSKTITAKTTLPKSGQEISWIVGEQLCPVVRGNDGQEGYHWGMPTHLRQVGDTMIQVIGLKALIQTIAPELLPRFSGKPLMMYVDGLVLAASIPMTNAILKEYRRKELQDDRLGLV